MNPLQTNPQTYLNETITAVLVFAGVLFIGLGLIILFERMKRKDQQRANRKEIDRLLAPELDEMERKIS